MSGLDPSALAKFGRLELLARLVVEGVMSGLHKSPFKGFSVEFAEHREYEPGDEIRHIDWRVYAKSDRYFIKEYEEETNLKAYLVVDCSGSMGYAGETHPKLEHARRLAAALAYLMVRQRDAVGLVAGGKDLRGMLPPRTTPGHFSLVCRTLEETQAAGPSGLGETLHSLAGRIQRRGLIVVLSDGFEPVDRLTSALRHLRHRHHEVMFFHVLAPEEEHFRFRSPARFRDLEQPGRELRVNPASLRAAYLERFEAHRKALKDALRSMDADYQAASTAVAPEAILLEYLASRTGRGGDRSDVQAGGPR